MTHATRTPMSRGMKLLIVLVVFVLVLATISAVSFVVAVGLPRARQAAQQNAMRAVSQVSAPAQTPAPAMTMPDLPRPAPSVPAAGAAPSKPAVQGAAGRLNLHGPVEVAAGETIEGDVVAVGGDVAVRGTVNGNAVAVKGSVQLYDGARVKGDALALGGNLLRAEHATVGGSSLQLDAPWAERLASAATAKAEEQPKGAPAASGPAGPAPATVHIASITRFGEAVTVAANEIVDGDVVTFGGHVTVLGKVSGDVASFGGPIDVAGEVAGDVASFGGPVRVSAGGKVNGDVATLGGPVTVDPAGTVLGDRVSMGSWRHMGGGWHRGPQWGPGASSAARAGGSGGVQLVLLLLVVLLFPRAAAATADRLSAEPLVCLAAGALTVGLFLPVVFLLFTLVVTWVAIPVLIFALIVAAILGVVGVEVAVGRHLAAALRWRISSLLLAGVVGWVLLRVCSAFPVVGAIVAVAVLLFGLGAAILALDRGRGRSWCASRWGTAPSAQQPEPDRTAAATALAGGPAEPHAGGSEPTA